MKVDSDILIDLVHLKACYSAGFLNDKYTMTIKISKFTIEFYESVFALWKQCEGVGLGNSDSKESILLFLNRNPGMSFIADVDNKIVGAVLAGHDGRRGYIHHLAVLPNIRRQGIGKLLVDECLNTFKDIGILKCHLFIFKTNENGLKFWESSGWDNRNDICVLSRFIDGTSN